MYIEESHELAKDKIVNPWDSAKEVVVRMLAEASATTNEIVLGSIEVPPDSALGDLSSTLAFALAKELKKNPGAIASEMLPKLQKMIEQEPLISKVETKGPYINIFFERAAFTDMTITSVSNAENTYGQSSHFKDKRVLIEFPAVNPSKPWHIGHARNAILGDTLSNILESVGYEVVRLDYINDLGLQIAQLVWKLKQISADEGGKKYDHYLGHLYVDVQETFDS